MSLMVKGSGGGGSAEDLTAVIAALGESIDEVEASLVGKATGANITSETVLEGYRGYNGKRLVVGTYVPPDPEGEYAWKKLTAQNGDFIDYVLDDDLDAYPDGGEQDGFWYELVEDLKPLLDAVGCTKVAIDKITFTEETDPNTGLKHSLGMKPKHVLIFTNGTVGTTSTRGYVVWAFYFTPYLTYFWKNYSYTSGTVSSTSPTLSATAVKFSGAYYYPNIEYTIITMA